MLRSVDGHRGDTSGFSVRSLVTKEFGNRTVDASGLHNLRVEGIGIENLTDIAENRQKTLSEEACRLASCHCTGSAELRAAASGRDPIIGHLLDESKNLLVRRDIGEVWGGAVRPGRS